MAEFISVASVDSLPPGRGRTIHVRGRDFALWNLDGQFFCVDDACPHRGASLGAGSLQGCELICPLHGWGFDVRTGDGMTQVQVCLGEDPQSSTNGGLSATGVLPE
jgi:nitrite reductase/ring-hydroxylating ferredoxin subunit